MFGEDPTQYISNHYEKQFFFKGQMITYKEKMPQYDKTAGSHTIETWARPPLDTSQNVSYDRNAKYHHYNDSDDDKCCF